MTATELSNEFNILWDNIESGSAPGVDEYEKSIFFTIAQEELILKYAEQFDSSERARRILDGVVKSLSKTQDATTEGITVNVEPLDSTYSKFYSIPDDLWMILHEHAIVATKRVAIVPISLDDYNIEVDNPFRKPNSKLIWRFDVNNGGANNERLVELISTNTITKYNLRYIKEPSPIITDGSISKDIRGVTPSTVLNPSINDLAFNELLDLAVNLAYKAFMDGRLKSQQ